MKAKIIFLYTMLCLIWGTTWLAIKISLNEGTPPLLGAGLRFLLAGIVLWGIFFIRRESLPWDKKAIGIYLQFGLLNFSLSYGITYWATQYIYSNLSAILWAGFPFVIAGIAHLMLPDDKLTIRKFISILIGTTGVILISIEGQVLGGKNVTLGILAIIIAVLIAAWPNVYLKKHYRTVNTLQLNTVSQTIAGITLVAASFWLESDRTMIWSDINIIALVYLALMGSVVTWLIYFWLFSQISVTQISYVAFFPPVIATIIGWLILDEKLTNPAIIGALLVLTGALLINFPGKTNDVRA